MKDPQSIILLDGRPVEDLNSSNHYLSFLNAVTGEWYNLPVPIYIHYYFWLDNMHFGFIDNLINTLYLVDINSGQVSVTPISSGSIAMLKSPFPLSAIEAKRNPSDGSFEFFQKDPNIRSYYSKSFDYYAQEEQSYQDQDSLMVTDQATGNIVWKFGPDGEWKINWYAWSPVNDKYLAIVRGKRDKTIDFQFPVQDTILYVFDISTGKVVTSLKTDIGYFVWSPDGSKILYQDAISLYWNFGYGFTKAPCLFYVETGKKNCIQSILNRPVPAGLILSTTSDYQWSLDAVSIYFVYEYTSPEERRSTACVYSLITGELQCPTDGLEALIEWSTSEDSGFWAFGWSTHFVDLSPDGNYLHFCYSSDSLRSDSQGGPSNDGVIRMDGKGLVYWFNTNHNYSYESTSCSFHDSIWRPVP